MFVIKPPPMLILILISSFLDSLTLMSTRPIISIYATQLGASPFVVGILFSVFAFFPIIFAIRFGKWTDHLGVKKMMIYGGLGCLVSLLIPLAMPTIFGLILSQMAMGLGHNCIMTATLTGASLSTVDRDKAVAAQATVYALGEFLGPLSSGFLYEHFGFRVTVGAAALSATAFLLLNLFARAYPPAAKTGKSRQSGQTFALLTNSKIRKGVIVSGMVVYSKDIFTAYFPIYATGIHLLPSEIGITLAIVAISSAAVRLFQFSLLKRFPRHIITVVCLFIAGLSFALTPFVTFLGILYLLAVVLGLGLGVVQPLSIVYMMNFAPPGREGEVIGMRSMFNRISQLTAPLFFGMIGGSLGLQPIFLSCGLTLIGGSWYSMERQSTGSGESTDI